MPPKRGRAAKAAPAPAPPKNTAKRAKRKKTSKSKPPSKSNHRAQNDAEILSAFRLFAIQRPDAADGDYDEDGEGVLKIADVRRCLSALNLPKPPPDFFDDPDQIHISYGDFLALAQTLRDTASGASSDREDADDDYDNVNEDKEAEEVSHAFALFTRDKGGGDVRITLADLKRVARELREEVDEGVLRLMIEEANEEQGRDSVGRGVRKEDFEAVMRRAGVFG